MCCLAPPPHPLGGGGAAKNLPYVLHLCRTLVRQVRQMALRPRRDELMSQKTIPQSVLTLLAQRWPADNDGRRPPRYLFRPDDSPSHVNGDLKHSQVLALVVDQVLTNDWRGAVLSLISSGYLGNSSTPTEQRPQTLRSVFALPPPDYGTITLGAIIARRFDIKRKSHLGSVAEADFATAATIGIVARLDDKKERRPLNMSIPPQKDLDLSFSP